MAMELVFLVTIIASLGALFLWVARSRASSLAKESICASAGDGLEWPKNCYDLCRQDSSQNSNACAVACSLLQD